MVKSVEPDRPILLMPRAVYTTLVVLLLRPAAGVDAQRMQSLQRIRHTYDAAYTRWLPHITLIPPFQIEKEAEGEGVPPSLAQTLDRVSTDAQKACDRTAAHTLRLAEIGTFRLRRYENVHLRPDAATASPLMALQRDLQKEVAPHIPKGKRRREKFVPHASLGQAYAADDKQEIVFEATRDLGLDGPEPGVLVQADRIQVMYKPSHEKGAYTLWRELALPHS